MKLFVKFALIRSKGYLFFRNGQTSSTFFPALQLFLGNAVSIVLLLGVDSNQPNSALGFPLKSNQLRAFASLNFFDAVFIYIFIVLW